MTEKNYYELTPARAEQYDGSSEMIAKYRIIPAGKGMQQGLDYDALPGGKGSHMFYPIVKGDYIIILPFGQYKRVLEKEFETGYLSADPAQKKMDNVNTPEIWAWLDVGRTHYEQKASYYKNSHGPAFYRSRKDAIRYGANKGALVRFSLAGIEEVSTIDD
ncbi:hypothetical protein FC83_GL000927 [Agrilactobacillus composti DSM 18527 = JCM 14202]|uniref:Uncharacterized protein n=1 Tax=Agrilactobacillus composti DSM 18527 = JCM 14202 TaxID=1423734 RepID=X0QR95_9LACO|nr:hypothetical protein [Agrilactobacillus composti]KRM35623.1 hypothetical protein FC83_GL000927 [Agrilactobacillus composti DSM 18527 = JCM 14202]GAF41140.1 hypothetical protein JCM14202_3065 [Agrilactobacillus composti DSM 18527 = JCM 14202]